ncbi:hypothetical protein BDZ89DRAFT_1172332 [Hymenopellis radicata]|nr:hypothetical protein BDZ89DRAFT_1172332 [Hymenopellis radicata]
MSWDMIRLSENSPKDYFEASPLRIVAKGKPLFRLRVIPWSDDVSGNVSKQYNAHTNIYTTNANLPHQQLSQEYFIRSCSTSSFASSSEQFVALSEDFKEDRWHNAYDCELEQEIMFQVIPHFLPADNPQQSETSSHLGVNASLNCRRDMSGGSEQVKESVEGYEALFHPGVPRECEKTISVIRKQIWLACHGDQGGIGQLSTETGVKDKIAQFWIDTLLAKAKPILNAKLKNRETRDQRLNERMSREDRKSLTEEITATVGTELWEWVVRQPQDDYEQLAVDDPLRNDIRPGIHYNILLCTRGINPHLDTPGEILHTCLLGTNKYVWHTTNKTWTKVDEETFAVRLQSSSITGLTIPPPRAAYLVQYKNSLIGKHFKTLQQIGVFHVHDLCTPDVFQLWKVTGELGALLWVPEIRDMDTYLADLEVLIANVLDAWGKVDPRRIITKAKLHVLTHLPDDIRRLGPAVIFATEVFECFNAIFRQCSILSNHLAPSHDISVALASMERFKHVVSGGWWKESEGRYVRAGPSIPLFLHQNRELQRRLGWTDHSLIKSGDVKRSPRAKRHAGSWETHTKDFILSGSLPEAVSDGNWENCTLLVSQAKDICTVGSWVFLKSSNGTRIGRIRAILCRAGMTKQTSVLLEHFEVADERDQRLNMPILVRTPTKQVLIAVPEDVLFNFNAQHDCVSGGCVIGDSDHKQVQERLETDKPTKCIIHADDDCFHLNMHGIHNAHLIRELLPRNLVAPIPLQADRQAYHRALSLELQVTGPKKRAETQAKAKETREKNKHALARSTGIRPNELDEA